MAHYLSGRQRTLVRRLQDTFQARSEWPTWLLIACLYGGWALLASQYERWGWPVLAGLVPFASLYMSLQHELIHGHPTRWPRFNAMLGYLPLAVWYPYPLYRDSHLRHHLDEQLTYPGLDPESRYVSLSEWPRLGSWRRRWLCLDKTLLGRATLGPLLALAAMARLEGSRLRQGEGAAWRLWGLHAVLLGGLLAGLWRWAGIPPWLYLPAVAYPALGLSMLRSFYEHRPAREPAQRSVLVEAGGRGGCCSSTTTCIWSTTICRACPGTCCRACIAQAAVPTGDAVAISTCPAMVVYGGATVGGRWMRRCIPSIEGRRTRA